MKKYCIRKGSLIDRIVNPQLLRNKLFAVVLGLLGWCSIPVSDGDGTAFVMLLMLAIPLFFASENYID